MLVSYYLWYPVNGETDDLIDQIYDGAERTSEWGPDHLEEQRPGEFFVEHCVLMLKGHLPFFDIVSEFFFPVPEFLLHFFQAP